MLAVFLQGGRATLEQCVPPPPVEEDASEGDSKADSGFWADERKDLKCNPPTGDLAESLDVLCEVPAHERAESKDYRKTKGLTVSKGLTKGLRLLVRNPDADTKILLPLPFVRSCSTLYVAKGEIATALSFSDAGLL